MAAGVGFPLKTKTQPWGKRRWITEGGGKEKQQEQEDE